MDKPQGAGNAIVTRPATQQFTQDPMIQAKVFADSGYFSDARQAAQAAVKVMAGAELGFAPVASMTGIALIKGKVTASANLLAAAIKRTDKYDFRVDELTDERCSLKFFENGEMVGTSEFTIEDAKKANLVKGDNWSHYPRNMLFARAVSNGAKWYCPDVFGGPIYTPDELGADIDGETGEIKPRETLNLTAPIRVGAELTVTERPRIITPEQAVALQDEFRSRQFTQADVVGLLQTAGADVSSSASGDELKAAINNLSVAQLRGIRGILSRQPTLQESKGGENND